MTELARSRSLVLLMSVGLGTTVFSIFAEDIGLGSGNGTFGAWQKAGVAMGLVAIVAGASWYWPPSRRWAMNGPAIFFAAGLVAALAAMVVLLAGFSDDPIDSAMTCEELEAAKSEALSKAGADYDASAAELRVPGSLYRPPTGDVMSRYSDRRSELGCNILPGEL